MKILITGAKGFIGKNLITSLRNIKDTIVFEFDKDMNSSLLEHYCEEAEFIYHLAGANRPKAEDEFMQCNAGFTSSLLNTLRKLHNTCPILYSSSAQAVLDNSYGRSKLKGEEELRHYSKETGAKVLIYRFPNVFGKWCRPNYNSVIATFCYNSTRNLPIIIDNPDTLLKLVYIDDLTEELIRALEGRENRNGDFCEVPVYHVISLGKAAELISSFRTARENLIFPDLSEAFNRKLFSTYQSYLSTEEICYPLKMNSDTRGSFTEFMKQSSIGQLSINTIKPGIIKGNHWHSSKIEKFIVVSGSAAIRLRNIHSDEVISYHVDSDTLLVVDIPPGYTHQIENIGVTDMVTLIWANELFDPDRSDTYYMEV